MESQTRRKPDPTLKPVAEKIQHIRKDLLKLTQEKFAEKMGVGRSAVSDWENQFTPIDARNLLKLCKLSGCDADYVLGRLNEKTHDIKEISDLTGLSPIAVEKLINNTHEKEKRLEEYRKNDEPLSDWYYQNGVTSTQIREYLINTLLTDDELWGALIRNACAAVDEMDRYLSQESGNLMLPPGVEDATGYMIHDSQHLDNINARRYAVSTAFSVFWDRLCTSAQFIEQRYVAEDSVPDDEHEYNNIIAYGLKKKILHE